MKKTFTRFAWLPVALGLGMLAAAPATAQTVYVPAAVTGYTADVIANGPGAVANSTTNTVDRGNATVRWCFADSTFVNPSGQRPTRALPPSGFFRSRTTPGLTYQMGPSNGNNSLRIDGAGAGTLTLTNPQACSEVLVLATEGNGSSASKTFVVGFTDGTTQTFTGVAVPDWFGNGATPAIIVGSRVNRPDNSIDNQPNDPTIYEVRLPLAVANYGKAVRNLTVSKTSTDPVLNVMGVSLGATCLTAPAGGTAAASATAICPGASTTLSLSGNSVSVLIGYQWQASTDNGVTWTPIGGATGSTYTAQPTVTTQYRARVNCSQQTGFSTPVTVTVTPDNFGYRCGPFYKNGPNAVPDLAAVAGTFAATNGLVINPTTGEVDLKASPVGTATITYTPTSGCARVTQLEVQKELMYPNIITANQDGKNDALKVTLPNVTGYRLQVFNRWGKRVYASTNAAEGWSAADSPAGTYYYLLEYTSCAGRHESYKNWLEVVK
ncbi:gliding motility-associated C-terminal domain-containing protein [Hymenobacter jeollabukensis]|uniref:Gliding motility-associated C-terminal domain-containing protein n=1 Tax=Hymenobacter jeollabukensis TaxID=2025313 RepID=A0A5R8WJL8_9BACT|nr:gliding motility-associated C-terminal domain-containing protein [Hymenobacter jeollabukensis]TLM89129.1 gliding motility-associated C-terminal domain-containing protein [Hymenobacter jeollabukensis]